ncbi:MAG: hypothetical protein M3O61_15445 [Gemmatimonadota bacterium]|nr:hypothetical protein [Gemmatimonadota bacterium]
MPRISLSAFAVVVVLSGCDASDAPTAPALSPLFSSGSRVTGHANGSGTFNIGAPGAEIAFDLNALLRADGSASGSVHYITDLTDFGLAIIEIRFRVTCLALDAGLGRAWIGGVVTENNSTNELYATDPKRQVGRDVWFRVQDNGNGGSGTLDRSTQLGFEGSAGITTSAEYCAARLWTAAPAHPVTTGNISVK